MLSQLLLAIFLSLLQPALAGAPSAPAAVPCPLTAAPLCLKLVVDEDGLYRVTRDDLQAAGWDVAALDPRSLSLSSQGQPVALRVAGEADGRLDPGDFVEFYGQRFRGDQMAEKYTDDNVYWLAGGGQAGPRMAELNVRPAGAPFGPTSFWTTLRAEQNNYWFSHQTLDWPTHDTWWWQRMTVQSAGHWQLPVVVPAPASEPYSATVQIELGTRRKVGGHHIQLAWQGLAGPLLDDVFYDHQLYRSQAPVPGSALIDGSNVLTVTVLNDQGQPFDDLYANHYDLRYRRRYVAQADQLLFTSDVTATLTFRLSGFTNPDLLLYDVSEPRLPRRLTGFEVGVGGANNRTLTAQLQASPARSFLALAAGRVRQPKQIVAPLPSSVRSPANAADWIVISHADFLAEAQRLASYRASHDGLRSAVVDVAELYEQFNDGIFHPEAIRRFIAYAVEHWQPPAPQYVLLLGDGNWNFKGYGVALYGPPDPNWIPPYLVWEDYWQGEVASDNAFVALDDASPLPSAGLAIGRLPARSAAEATVMVDKIIAYESQGGAGPLAPWQRRALFVADNADESGNYPAVADAVIAGHLPRTFRVQRAYLGVTHSDPLSITHAISQAINSGVALVTYLGHGAVPLWANEQLWTTSHVPQLHNGERLPIVLTFNCLDGYFIYGDAGYQSLAEEMLRHAGGGSVAAWSPAGLGTTVVEHILHTALLDAIFVEGERRLGPATARAKAVLYDTWGEDGLLHTMTLFGDPAMTLATPAWQQSLPLVQRGSGR